MEQITFFVCGVERCTTAVISFLDSYDDDVCDAAAHDPTAPK